MSIAEQYPHLPAGILACLERYERDLSDGTVVPWDPETRTESCPQTSHRDAWLSDWMSRVPRLQVNMRFAEPRRREIHLNDFPWTCWEVRS